MKGVFNFNDKRGDRHPFIDDQGREAVNFQLSIAIYLVSVFILWLILVFTTFAVAITNPNTVGTIFGWAFTTGIAFLVLFGLFQFYVIILASVKALQGQSYQYPFTLRFLQ